MYYMLAATSSVFFLWLGVKFDKYCFNARYIRREIVHTAGCVRGIRGYWAPRDIQYWVIRPSPLRDHSTQTSPARKWIPFTQCLDTLNITTTKSNRVLCGLAGWLERSCWGCSLRCSWLFISPNTSGGETAEEPCFDKKYFCSEEILIKFFVYSWDIYYLPGNTLQRFAPCRVWSNS